MRRRALSRRWHMLRVPARAPRAPARREREPLRAARRRSLPRAAPHLVELRLQLGGAHRAGEARLARAARRARRAVPARARRRARVHPAARNRRFGEPPRDFAEPARGVVVLGSSRDRGRSREEAPMRRPLFAVLSVLVAATFASGHSAAQGSQICKDAGQGTDPEAGVGDGVHEVPAAEAGRGRRAAHGVAQLLPRSGQVRDFVGGPLRRRRQAGREVGRSGDLGGQHRVRLRLRHRAAETTAGGFPACAGTARRRRRVDELPATTSDVNFLARRTWVDRGYVPAANFPRRMRITANQVTIARLIGLPFVGALSVRRRAVAHHRRHPGDADRPHRHGRRLPGAQVRRDGARVAAGSRRRQGVHRRLPTASAPTGASSRGGSRRRSCRASWA